MSNAVYEIRRARKEHRCSERSYHTIRPGDLYLYAVLPPWHDMNSSRKSDPGGRKFWVIKACLRCCEEFGMHSNETRAAIQGTLEVGQ